MPVFQYLGGHHGRGLLESALGQPRQTFQGRYLYRTIFDKAAALFHSLIKNHPLLDGNKRLALAAVAVFLHLNGYMFYVTKDEAVTFSLALAADEGDIDLRPISRWFRRNTLNLRADPTHDTLSREKLNFFVTRAAPFQIVAMQQLIKFYKETTATNTR